MTPSTLNSCPLSRRQSQRRWLAVWICLTSAGLVLLVFWRDLAVYYDLGRGKSALSSRQPQRALKHLRRLIERNGSHAAGHFLLARCYRHRGEMSLVRRHLGIALSLGYSSRVIVREEWLALAQSGQMREAEPHLSELLVDAQDDGQEICEAYVNGYFATTRFAEANELLDVWRKSFPEDAQPYLFQGRYLESHGSTTAAVEAYRGGVARAPQRRDLRIGLARCLTVLHAYDEATELLRKLSAEAPPDPEVLALAAMNDSHQAKLAEARQTLDVLLRLQPNHATGRLLLAKLLLQETQTRQALAILEDLARSRPYDVEVRYQQALALASVGEKQRAVQEFAFVAQARETMSRTRRVMERVSNQEPKSADLRYEIGTALLQYESPQAGADWLRSALNINPYHRLSHEALAKYHEQMQHPEQAKFHRDQAQRAADSAASREDQHDVPTDEP